jgi:hypothetical protein
MLLRLRNRSVLIAGFTTTVKNLVVIIAASMYFIEIKREKASNSAYSKIVLLQLRNALWVVLVDFP